MVVTTSLGRSVFNLGRIARIPLGEGRTFEVDQTAVAVFRTRSGKLFATQAFCPHKAGPLADGLVGPAEVICPLHGSKFDLTTGRPVGNECQALTTYPVLVTNSGEILLELDR